VFLNYYTSTDTNTVHTLAYKKGIRLCTSHIIICLMSTPRFSKWLFPSGLLFPIRATCPAHLLVLSFIARIIFGEECKWRYSKSSYFFSSLQLPLLCQAQISSSAPSCQNPSANCFLWYTQQSFTSAQNKRQNCSFVFILLDSQREDNTKFWEFPEFYILLI
jgi:hypothetical protein